MATSTCSAMSSIHVFQTPLSTQMNPIQLHAESCILRIDNRASRCISQHKGDFIGNLWPYTLTIHGYAGRTTKILNICTIRWKCMDNVGRTQKCMIPNSIHYLSGQNLMSPYHWAKHTGDGRDKAGLGSTTTEHEAVLSWGNRKFQKTILITRWSNIANIHTAPSYNKYKEFVAHWGCVQGEDAITDYAYSAIHEDAIGNSFLKCQDIIIMESILEPFDKGIFHPKQTDLSSAQAQILQSHKKT